MATIQMPRQPFGVLSGARLQSISSVKNRQNGFTIFSSNEKPDMTKSTPSKKRTASSFENDSDSENVKPVSDNGSSKRSKAFDGTPKKAGRVILCPKKPSAVSISCPPTIKKAVEEKPAQVTPRISTSRGSPKNKRVGILKNRRASSSPFRRIDPPAFSRAGPTLPFSLNEALNGGVSAPAAKPAPVEASVPTLEEAMPKSWFFDIHVDTPEEEAANIMEHCANTLDISSDDDVETKRRNEELESGKENIPPPDFLALLNTAVPVSVDAMAEDRTPLGDLAPADFYAPGLDASSVVIIDGPQPSALCKEVVESDIQTPAPVVEEAKDIPVLEEAVVSSVAEAVIAA